jgi:dolichyl-phosphate-mannose--protein O-mannosyl transferase
VSGSLIAGVYVLAVLVLFWYFYPILTGQVIPYSDWLSHMWYQGLFGPALGWI